MFLPIKKGDVIGVSSEKQTHFPEGNIMPNIQTSK
jgi:hypothetical protein